MDEAVQLLARGVQDVWLSGDPQVSFFRSTYRRHEQFAADTILHHVPLSGTVSIQRKGDLLGYMYLTAHDSNGTLVPGLDWSTLVDTIDLVIGRQKICSHDIQYINTIRGVLEASNWSQRFGPTQFQPLGFFTDTWPLPLGTLKYTDIDVVISIKSQAYRYRLWTQQIFLSESERKWFDSTTHRLLIPQVQRLPVTNEPSFRGPIKYIAWPSVNYSKVYIPIKPINLGFTSLKGSSNDQGSSIALDSSGNIYVTGYYNSASPVPVNNIALNSTPVDSGYTLPITSSTDIFILKYAPDGTISSFTTLKGSLGDVANSIAVDSSGNIYVTGYYNSASTVPVNNMALNSTPVDSGYTLPISTGLDMFILKYAPDGTISSFTTLKGSSADQGISITVDSSRNIYVSGAYNSGSIVQINNMALNSTPVDSTYRLPITSANDMFVLKYAPDGTISSFTTLKGVGADQGNSIVVDSSGNIYITGGYNSSSVVAVNNMALNSTPVDSTYRLPISSGSDIFVLKYAPDGTISSFTTVKGSLTDLGSSVAVDSSGNIYVTGYYNSASTVPVNNMALNSTPVDSTYRLPITSANDVFVLKYAPDGTISSFTTLKGSGGDQGNSMAVDSSGNIYVTGYYNSSSVVPVNTMALNSTPVVSGYTLPITSANDVFVLKYAPDGTISSFTTLKGSGGDQGNSMAVDSSGNIYVTGYYNSSSVVPVNTMALNSTPVDSGYTLPITSSNDMFLIKYAPS